MIKFTKSLIALTLWFYLGESVLAQEFVALVPAPNHNVGWMPQSTNSTSMIKAIDTIPNPTANQAMMQSPLTAHCYCYVSYNDLTNDHGATGVCLDLKQVINKTYHGVNCQSEANRNDCNSRCTNVAAALSTTQKQDIANCACGANVGNGTPIRAYSKVGTTRYKTAQMVGTLVNTPAVTTTSCVCPTDWHANAPITPNSKCAKGLCGPMTATLAPPNGTQLGTWGFTWDNYVYVWGTAANGGALKCTTEIISPKICKLQ
jgi:hypothetical protein